MRIGTCVFSKQHCLVLLALTYLLVFAIVVISMYSQQTEQSTVDDKDAISDQLLTLDDISECDMCFRHGTNLCIQLSTSPRYVCVCKRGFAGPLCRSLRIQQKLMFRRRRI